MVSPEHDQITDFMNSYWLWLPRLELHKMNPVNILAQRAKRLLYNSHSILWSYGELIVVGKISSVPPSTEVPQPLVYTAVA